MDAKEFILKRLNPAPSWNEKIISFDFDDLCEHAEAYNKSQQRKLLKDFCEHIESTIDYLDCDPNVLIDSYFDSI